MLAVGGTQLTVDSAGDYILESAWSSSAGGSSHYEAAPAAQKAVTGKSARTAPDVSYDAGTFYAVYTSVAINGLSGWVTTGGTSAGTPQWAALLAIADQGRALAGKPPITDAVSAIYGLPAGDFHDVTTGSNGSIKAGSGYDAITGRGSPYADRVVSGLVGPLPAPTPPPPPTPTPPPAPKPPASNLVNLTFIAQKVASFVQKTTSSTPAVPAVPQSGGVDPWDLDVQ